MSYESTAEPIKIGYLMDFKLPDLYPQEMKEDLSNPFDLVFGEALEQGLIDRPIEIIYKEVEGLPEGIGQGGHRRIRRIGRRGLPCRVRPAHHR